MHKLLILFSILFFNEKAYSLNIFELTAIGTAIPLLYDQYFDNSLKEENMYQKSNKIINKHTPKKITPDLNPKIHSTSDLIYYLEMIEEINFYNKNYWITKNYKFMTLLIETKSFKWNILLRY